MISGASDPKLQAILKEVVNTSCLLSNEVGQVPRVPAGQEEQAIVSEFTSSLLMMTG